MRAWMGAVLGFPVQLQGVAKPSVEISWIDGGSVGFA